MPLTKRGNIGWERCKTKASGVSCRSTTTRVPSSRIPTSTVYLNTTNCSTETMVELLWRTTLTIFSSGGAPSQEVWAYRANKIYAFEGPRHHRQGEGSRLGCRCEASGEVSRKKSGHR